MRRPLLWWPLLVVPALAACGWLAIWLQWYLPGDPPWGLDITFASIAIGGFAAGVGFAATRHLFWIMFAALAIWPPHVPLSAFLWAVMLLVVRGFGLALAGGLGLNAARAWPGPWRLPLAVALGLIAVTLMAGLHLDDRKVFWPWSAHQQELIALRRDATAAAHRLGLRASLVPFDDETRRRLSAAVPIETTIEFPLTRRRVTARIVDTDSHLVWIDFHDGRSGPLEPTRMHFGWNSY